MGDWRVGKAGSAKTPINNPLLQHTVALNTRRNPTVEPTLDPATSPYLDAGLAEFNAGRHWHAHEAWEHLWLGLEGEDKLFVQGLIMAAAMLVQYEKKVQRGVLNHYQNVEERVAAQSVTKKWGIDIQTLLTNLQPYLQSAQQNDYRLATGNVQIRRI